MSTPIVIVTGANRGIGQAICHQILSEHTHLPLLSSSSSSGGAAPFRLLATSRKGEDLGFQPRNPDVTVQYSPLDIGDPQSVRGFAEAVRRDGGEGRVRCLINNAGVNLDGAYGVEHARRTVDVNFWGTLEMCQRFIPLLAPEGRIVNLSSVASGLGAYSEQIQQRFRNPDVTVQDLEKLCEEYLHSIPTSTESRAGFSGPGRSYSVSKACVNALTRLLAREHQHNNLTINACCPGWVATDMGAQIGRPPKTPVEGARVPVKVGFGDIGGVTGEYWANDSVRSRGEGRVQEW